MASVVAFVFLFRQPPAWLARRIGSTHTATLADILARAHATPVALGTALAAHVAAERPVAGAVLVSPFDSLTAIGNHHYPWLPVSLLM